LIRTAPSPNRQNEIDPIGAVAICDCWTLTEKVSVTVGVWPSVTTGARKTKPPRMIARQATAEIVFAFLDMLLSRAGLEQAAQSPQRHPWPQTSHVHLADSCWNTFNSHLLVCAPSPS